MQLRSGKIILKSTQVNAIPANGIPVNAIPANDIPANGIQKYRLQFLKEKKNCIKHNDVSSLVEFLKTIPEFDAYLNSKWDYGCDAYHIPVRVFENVMGVLAKEVKEIGKHLDSYGGFVSINNIAYVRVGRNKYVELDKGIWFKQSRPYVMDDVPSTYTLELNLTDKHYKVYVDTQEEQRIIDEEYQFSIPCYSVPCIIITLID